MNRKAGPALVDQTTLARTLGVTPRRVRQLIDDGVIRPATAGKWDVDVEIERFALFKTKDEGEWDRLLSETERQSDAVDRLITTACGSAGTGTDIELAAAAADELLDRLLLICAIRSKSASEREMFSGMLRQNHSQQQQALSARMFELWSEKVSVPPEIIAQKLREDAAPTTAKLGAK